MDITGVLSTASNRNAMVDSQRHDATVSELERFRDILQKSVEECESRETIDRARIREAAEMFEAHFLQMLFREMRRTNFNENGFFSRDNAQNIWTDMLDEIMADQASQTNGGMGIADMIYKQMTMRYRDNI